MITIGSTSIKLLQADGASLPAGQSGTYQLLASLGAGTYSVREIVERSNLKSPLPLWSRLQHLEQKGLIEISTLATTTAAG
jgi:SOS-response transcriptional repressor LexA